MTKMTGDPLANLLDLMRRMAARLHLLILLPVFAVMLLALLWTTLLVSLAGDRNAAINLASANAESLAQTYEERTTRILRQIDQTSQFLKYAYESHGSNFTFSEFVKKKGMLPTDVTVLISLVNDKGIIVASNHTSERTFVGDREYFSAHHDDSSDVLLISRPVLGRVSGKWIIVLSRRLNNPDGSFAGALLFSVEPDYLTSISRMSGLGQSSFVGLVGTDGALRSQRIGAKTFNSASGNFLSWLRTVAENSGGRVSDSPFDDQRRIFGLRQLQEFPLVAIVGIAEEEALAGFHHHRKDYLLSGFIGSIGIIAFTVLLMLQSYRLRKSEQDARETHAILSAAANGSLDAFFILHNRRAPDRSMEDFIFVDINERGAALLGLPKEQLIGQGIRTLDAAVPCSAFFEKYVQVVETGEPVEEDVEMNAHKPDARWLHHQAVPLENGVAVTVRDISARKYAEMETRNNRAFLHSLIDYLPVLIYARSLRPENYGQMIVWNKSAEIITGYAAAEVIGKSNQECFAADVATQFDLFDREMLANPQVADRNEVPFRTKSANAELRFLHVISVPLFDESNRVEYILSIAEDITGRREQELELRTQQAELAAVNDASPLGLFRTSPDGVCTYVNRTYEEMSGLTREQALGDGWAKSIHPEDRLKVFQAWSKASRTKQPYQGVYRFRHPNGRIVWASMKTAQIVVDGKNQGHVGSVDDITARREAEQALAKSEQRMRTITDTLPALIAFVDASERYRFNNLAYERAFRMSRDLIRNKTIREFLGDAEYALIKPYIARVLNGETVRFETEDSGEGPYRCAESTYIPQMGEDGTDVVGFHVMVQDVTSKKLEERRLVQLAQIDSLTGLMNRAGFEQKLSDAMAQAQTSNGMMAVMYLDIDHFKNINDSHGHLAGDMLLKSFASRLTRNLRTADTVARLGGDEFTVIMEGLASADDAINVTAKLVQSMQMPFLLDGITMFATCSVGVAFYQTGEAAPKTLIKQADEMLYEAKAAGRNTYCIGPAPAS